MAHADKENCQTKSLRKNLSQAATLQVGKTWQPGLLYFRGVNAAGLGHSHAVGRVGFGAVTDVPQFN